MYALSPPCTPPFHSELLPWLPGMVAKSLLGRVGVGCAATNITMVNQGTPGVGSRGRGLTWVLATALPSPPTRGCFQGGWVNWALGGGRGTRPWEANCF